MVNLEQKKASLQAQIEAIELLEGLDPNVLAEVEKVIKSTPNTAANMVECDVCGQMFKTSGIKRHRTVTHGL